MPFPLCISPYNPNAAKEVFFISEVNFADGGTYSADLNHVKQVALTDKQ